MEGFMDKNRSNAKAYYIKQCKRVKSKARMTYKIIVESTSLLLQKPIQSSSMH